MVRLCWSKWELGQRSRKRWWGDPKSAISWFDRLSISSSLPSLAYLFLTILSQNPHWHEKWIIFWKCRFKVGPFLFAENPGKIHFHFFSPRNPVAYPVPRSVEAKPFPVAIFSRKSVAYVSWHWTVQGNGKACESDWTLSVNDVESLNHVLNIQHPLWDRYN